MRIAESAPERTFFAVPRILANIAPKVHVPPTRNSDQKDPLQKERLGSANLHPHRCKNSGVCTDVPVDDGRDGDDGREYNDRPETDTVFASGEDFAVVGYRILSYVKFHSLLC